MTDDKVITNNLNYLDSILDYLVKNATDYSSSFETLYSAIYGRNFEEDNREFVNGVFHTLSGDSNFLSNFEFNISDNNKAEAEKLVEALYFLNKKEHLRISDNWQIKLTFQGILKSSDNFTLNYQKKLSDSERLFFVENTQMSQNNQMINVNKKISHLTLWIMIGALVASAYYLLLIVEFLFPKVFS